MTFDLHKLARAAEFSLTLGSAGVVRCKSLSSDLMSQTWQRLKTSEAADKETDVLRWLLGKMARRPTVVNFNESDLIDGESLTSEQLTAVTDQELESFCEKVLQKNRFLVKSHGGKELKQAEGESSCNFLARAVLHRCTENKAQIDRIVQPATRQLFSESTLDSIIKSLTASNQFETLIQKYSAGSALDSLREGSAAFTQFDRLGKQYTDKNSIAERVLSQEYPEHQISNPPQLHSPNNPILETNQILENLSVQIEGMRPLVAQGAELIRCMNDTALRMQSDFIFNTEESSRQTKKAMRVAVLSLFVSAVGLVASSWFSYQTYADGIVAAKESKDQSKAFENLQRDLMTAQHEDRLLLTKALADLKQPTPSGKK